MSYHIATNITLHGCCVMSHVQNMNYVDVGRRHPETLNMIVPWRHTPRRTVWILGYVTHLQRRSTWMFRHVTYRIALSGYSAVWRTQIRSTWMVRDVTRRDALFGCCARCHTYTETLYMNIPWRHALWRAVWMLRHVTHISRRTTNIRVDVAPRTQQLLLDMFIINAPTVNGRNRCDGWFVWLLDVELVDADCLLLRGCRLYWSAAAQPPPIACSQITLISPFPCKTHILHLVSPT